MIGVLESNCAVLRVLDEEGRQSTVVGLDKGRGPNRGAEGNWPDLHECSVTALFPRQSGWCVLSCEVRAKFKSGACEEQSPLLLE